MVLNSSAISRLPKSSEVLTSYLKQRSLPHWTSYFVKYRSVYDDQWGYSHFNWAVENQNYHILRTGCWPYIKYHCSKRNYQDLSLENNIFKLIKVLNFGIPCLAYGIGAHFLISHEENVQTSDGIVKIYFLYKENETSPF